MHSTKRIVIDLLSGGYSEPAHVVQGDAYSRTVELDIRQEKTRWTIPNGLSVVVEYHKLDGTKGVYDTLPDGTRAWSAEGNILTLQLAPQMLTAPGTVVTQVRMMKGDAILSLFKFHVFVHQRIAGGISEDYINLDTFLPQVEGAKVGQYFKVAEVDDAGRATKIKAVDAPQGGSVDIPEKLPNPHALTINGTSYDGSEAVRVEIPQGGGGSKKWVHIAQIDIVEDTNKIYITEDVEGKPFEVENIHAFFKTVQRTDDISAIRVMKLIYRDGKINDYDSQTYGPLIQQNNFGDKNRDKYYYYESVVVGNYRKVNVVESLASFDSAINASAPSVYEDGTTISTIKRNATIDGIVVTAVNGFKVGDTIDIWGI